MYTKFWLVFIAVPLMVSCQQRRPTYCELWKGSSEFACRKTNYGMDSINIRNIGNSVVSFRISKWMSRCGQAGVCYSDVRREIAPGASIDEVFYEAEGNSCNELFIANCIRDGQNVDCLFAVTPSVNPRTVQCIVN